MAKPKNLEQLRAEKEQVETQLAVLPPYEKSNNSEWYSGTANAIYQNMNYMEQYHRGDYS